MKLVARTVQGYRRRRLPRNPLGMRRKRRVGCRKRRRVRRGGFLGNILRGIHSVARSVPIVSTALRATGNPLAGSVAGALGYGRRRRVRRGGIIGPLLRGVLGMRRMRRRRVRRGGLFRKLMGIVPLAMRGSRRRRRVRRGGFKRRGTTTFGGFRRKGYVQWGGIRHAPRRPLVSGRIIRRSGMRRRIRRGRGIMDMLRKAHSFAKENKLISRGLSMIPHKYAKTAGTIASSLGYGKRRRMRLGRRRRVGMRRRRRVGMRRRRRVGMGYLPNVSRF